VSYGTEAQLLDISETQAKAFFEPVMPFIDPLLLQYFRGDVSVTLGRKYEYLDSRRFAPLVAVKERDDDFGNRFGTKGLSFSGRWPANASADAGSPEDAAAPIMGVVELSIQRDEDVLARLPLPGDDGAGLQFIRDEVVGWARDQRRGHGAMGDAQVAGAEHATEARAVGGRRTRGRVRVRVVHVRQG
jgi:hypothetical protein